MKAPLLALVLLVPGAALAGPYDQPYSMIETDHIRSADPNVIPVIVNRVDDENAMPNHKAVVPPGRHEVTVDVPPRRGFHGATQHTFELTTEPCVRYYVSARLENVTSQRWAPFVRGTERMQDCESKFGGPKR